MKSPLRQRQLRRTLAPASFPVKRLSICLAAALLQACGGGGGNPDALLASVDPIADTQADPQAVGLHMAAALTSLSPSTAAVGSKTFTLEVTGSYFRSKSTVMWNGSALSTVMVDRNHLSAVVPASRLGSSGSVKVTVVSGTRTTAPLTFTIAPVASAMAIDSVSPVSATAGAASTLIVVKGSNFTTRSLVKWNNVHMPTTFVSATQLSAQVPTSNLAKAGVGAITVVTGNVTSNAVNFVVKAAVTDGGSTGSGTGSGSGTGAGGTGSGGGAGTGPGTGGTGLALRVSGNHFVDAAGAPVQLRGANLSVLEYWLIQGQDPAAPWGGQPNGNTSELPDFSLMSKKWAMNVVRLPLNEASWLGLTCTDIGGASGRAPGTKVNADPAGNYKATVQSAVAAANAAGLYVILDLHWAAPGNACPNGQNPFADADHSLDFWTSVANTFKGNPAVVFEAFNEPFPYWLSSSSNYWTLWDGAASPAGTFNQLTLFGNAPNYQMAYDWNATSMQAMVNSIRATGAKNVVLIAGENWSGDLSGWLNGTTARVKDPVSPAQMGAVWHAYPSTSSGAQNPPGTGYDFTGNEYLTPANQTNFPKTGPSPVVAQRLGVEPGSIFAQVNNILNAGYPVIITEYGDQAVVPAKAGTAPATAAPFAAEILQFADNPGAANGANVSYVAWSFNSNQSPLHTLLKTYPNPTAEPTPGFGVYVQSHYQCRAGGASNCQ